MTKKNMWVAQKFCKTTQAIENKLSGLRNRIFPEIRYSKYRHQLVDFVRHGLKDGEHILQKAFEELCHESEKNILLRELQSLIKKRRLSCDYYQGGLTNLNVSLREDLREIGLGVRKKQDLSLASPENSIEISFNQTKTSIKLIPSRLILNPDQICHRDIKIYVANEILKACPRGELINSLSDRLTEYLKKSKLVANKFNAIPNDITILPQIKPTSHIIEDKESTRKPPIPFKRQIQINRILAIGLLTVISIALSSYWVGLNSSGYGYEKSLQISNIEGILIKKHYINKIHHRKILTFFSQSDGYDQNHVISITGYGGMGKTTLAQLYSKSQPASIKWKFNCGSKDQFLLSLTSLAREIVRNKPSLSEELTKIEKTIDDDKFEKFLYFIRTNLPKKSKKIFIFDNLNATTAGIMKLLPRQTSKWGKVDIIITSRDLLLGQSNGVCNCVHINKIHKQDFLKILQLYVDINQPSVRKDLDATLKNCYLSPLLASILAREKLHHPEKKFQQLIEKAIYHEDNNPYDSNKSGLSVKSLLTKNIKANIFNDSRLTQMILCLSYLSPQSVPLYLIEEFFSDLDLFTVCIKLKRIYGVISNEGKYQTISFHQSVHKIISSCVQKNYLNLAVVNEFMRFLAKKTLLDNKSLDHERMKISFIHLKQIVKRNKAKKLESFPEIYYAIGQSRKYFGQRQKALRDFSHALKLLSRIKNPALQTQVLCSYSMTKRYLGQYKEAISLLEAECKYPLLKNEKIRIFATLATLYRDIGNYNKSINLYNMCLEIEPNSLLSKIELAILYYKVGLPTKGHAIYRAVQSELSHSLNNGRLKEKFKLLEVLYLSDNGNHKMSSVMLREMLDNMIKRHGENYLLTGLLYCEVGENYLNSKKLSEGFCYFKKGLFIIMKRVGMNNAIFMRKKLKYINLMIDHNQKNPKSELNEIRKYVIKNNPNFVPYLYRLEKKLGVHKPQDLSSKQLKQLVNSLYPKESKLYNFVYQSLN